MPKEQKVKPCDNCKVKKRKCDGNLPCSTCSHARKLTTPCSYSDNVLTIGAGGSTDYIDKEYLIKRVKELEQIIVDLKATKLTTPPSSFSNSTLEAFLSTSVDSPIPSYNDFGFDSLFVPGQNFNPEQLYPSPFAFDVAWQMQTPLEFNQIALEIHLLSLAPTFLCTQSTGERGEVISPLQRLHPLSECFKKAICFHAVFISTHPSLFNASSAPTFQERLKIATKLFEFRNSISYSRDGIYHANKFSSNRELCDEICSLLLSCVSHFSIGNGSKAIDLISNAFLMVRLCGLLNPTSFGIEADHKPTSMDEISAFFPAQVPPPQILTEQEKADRLMLLFQLLACDLYQSMVSANGFLIDADLIPNTNFQPITSAQDEIRDENPELNAKYTLWESTPYAASFSRILNFPNSFSNSALYKAQCQIQMIKFFRKVMTWSRANSKGQPPSINDQLVLHNTCLGLLDKTVGIESISAFMFGKLDSNIPNQLYLTTASLELNLCHAEYLAMLCYIHYPSVTEMDRKFPIDGDSIYSSVDILFGVARSLHFIIRRARGEDFAPKNLPPPSICHAVFALLCYVIGSSVAVAFQSVKADYQQKVIVFGLLADINQTLRGIGGIWPISRLFHEKLSQRLGL